MGFTHFEDVTKRISCAWLRPENNGVNGYGSDTMVTGGCSVGWQWPGWWLNGSDGHLVVVLMIRKTIFTFEMEIIRSIFLPNQLIELMWDLLMICNLNQRFWLLAYPDFLVVKVVNEIFRLHFCPKHHDIERLFKHN